MNLSLSAAGSGQPASLEWTLNYSATDFSSAGVEVGPAAAQASKSVSCQNQTGSLTCMLWGLSSGIVSDGVVATVSLNVSPSTSNTSSTVQILSPTAANPSAAAISASASGGTVIIVQPPGLNGFSCSPILISPPIVSTCTVDLTSAAGSGGATITLNSSPADVNIASTVTVPQGATSTTFSVTAKTVGTTTPVTLTASYSGVNETFGLTVNPPPAALSSVSVNPATIIGGQSGTGTVSLTAAAGSGGAVVSISSSNSDATVPASVAIPQGSTSATFSVTTGSVTTATSITLTASYAGIAQTAALMVNPVSSATYTGLDTTTQGTWTGKYGADGYLIANDATNPPAYATVSLTGDALTSWAASTLSAIALQDSSGSSFRIASCYHSTTSFNINVNLTDGNTHRIALYLLDWDSTTRSETISILDAASNTVLNTETFSSFHNGEYAVWNVQGNVIIQVTRTAGANAVVSGIFFDPISATSVPNVVGDSQAAATTAITVADLAVGTVTNQSSSTVASGDVISESPVAGTMVTAGSAVNLVVSTGPAGEASATYVGLDTTTQGTWTGKYGADGYLIANDATNPPAYATVSLTGDALTSWAASTLSAIALQDSSGSSFRIASCYHSTTSFNINVNLTDGNTHRIALYLLDWDSTTRSETISILDAASNTVLNTETFSSFHNGDYAVWNVQGNVIIQVTRTAGANAVVSGIFFK